MTQTIRRERIQKFKKETENNTIFKTLLSQHFHNTFNPSPSELEKMVEEYMDKFYEALADASISRTEKQTDETKGKYVTGIESAIFAGRPVTEEDINPAKIEHDALVAFEASFGVNTEKGQMLAWYGRKPEWNRLRKDVVELYQADPQCFEKYKVWRLTPYVKGAVSLKDVQRDPKCFMASWVAFVEAQPKESESKKFEDGSAYV